MANPLHPPQTQTRPLSIRPPPPSPGSKIPLPNGKNIYSPRVPRSRPRIRISVMKPPVSILAIFIFSSFALAQFRQTAILHPIRVVVWDEQQPQQKPAYDN